MITRRKWYLLILVCLMALVGTTGPLFGQSLKVAGTMVPLPPENEDTILKTLKYGHPWSTQFTSIRWTVDKEKGDQTQIEWTVSGFSGRARPQRARFEINVLDKSGEELETAIKTVIFLPSTKDQTFKIKMKIPSEKWPRAEDLRIMVNFFIGS